jgi:hypothetical protein
MAMRPVDLCEKKVPTSTTTAGGNIKHLYAKKWRWKIFPTPFFALVQ